MSNRASTTSLGFGLGLRPDHYIEILRDRPAVDWFEIISENYMVPGGRPLHFLDRFRERYPLVMHGVSMSIGSVDPLDMQYLRDLKALAQRVEPEWISDHLCWTAVDGVNLHDLMPLPYTEEALLHVARRVKQVQDFLGRRILLENVSSYVTYTHSQMQEWEFLAALTAEADCDLLLDVNNIYVSSVNHEFDADTFLAAIPAQRVRQMHLAGHQRQGEYLIDTHDQPVPEAVWDLYRKAFTRFPNVSTMIERDGNIPAVAELVGELDRAREAAGEGEVAAA
ncbi:hypothetical protein HNQ60_002161 [Povalibacter uvarum]|uniref:UPF0276 protein HNQ60_002161 n=1 Tax=Povalibacter uvarum TaxID=732238 RepID=A0A841HKM0_9GAMM|nr:DUF692 domain-containing protein [Povalibacter uvarum]MBB6093283.1 hypothetical protein [Povalibacter uvarum]